MNLAQVLPGATIGINAEALFDANNNGRGWVRFSISLYGFPNQFRWLGLFITFDAFIKVG
jgi:hypothetical protein